MIASREVNDAFCLTANLAPYNQPLTRLEPSVWADTVARPDERAIHAPTALRFGLSDVADSRATTQEAQCISCRNRRRTRHCAAERGEARRYRRRVRRGGVRPCPPAAPGSDGYAEPVHSSRRRSARISGVSSSQPTKSIASGSTSRRRSSSSSSSISSSYRSVSTST